MLDIYKPNLDDLWFRENLMADEDTMSYNKAWGGTIAFPKDKWQNWHQTWIEGSPFHNYYRYLYDTDSKNFVGEIAYHYDKKRKIHICNVIILAKYRNKGFGAKGIQLLCTMAKQNGVLTLYDDIAADNQSYKLFLKNGFTIDYQNNEVVMVKKTL
ncbi:GNAT family N-acetyltransferase [Anaerorhabdus sp.]|uniref:GNAT family N-acetyltransferase n=1 Tax=Anaerorhabdus sp. TaxID=1872524 RepID=UPI002FC7DE6A